MRLMHAMHGTCSRLCALPECNPEALPRAHADASNATETSYGMQDVRNKLKHDFWSTYCAELALWPAFQTWNFAKVRLCMSNRYMMGD